MVIEFSLILLGCVLLAFGADWLVSAAAIIAEHFRIPKAVAGLTVVALGTSAPELIVNVLSAARGDTDFAMSNVAGSNLANLCVGFGLCAVMGTLTVSLRTFRTDLLWLILTPGVIVAALLTTPVNVVGLPVASILSVILVIYFVSVVRRSRGAIEEEPGEQPIGRALLMLAGGSLLLYVGAELVLQMSSKVAGTFGISSAIIGLTIVAAGTSIPDIAASVVAIRRGETDMAVGNLIGSNISNIVFVLNATLIVSWNGLSTDRSGTIDFVAVLCSSLLFAAILLPKQRLAAQSGIALIVLYLCYVGWRIAELMTAV